MNWVVPIAAYCQDKEGLNFLLMKASNLLRNVSKPACLMQLKNITLILENHYKDDFWEYPEFAQKMNVFCQLVERIHHPNFGVNYDPSNAYLAGDDPIELLKRVSDRVVTMHASDRYLKEGTIEDLRKEESGVAGYAKRLSHGEIGKGLNDYDAIFTELKSGI